MSYYYMLAWREAGHRMTMVKLALVKGSGATYPFLPPLPFSQVGWEWVGGNWHSLVWLAYDFIFFSSVPQCSAKWLYLIPPGSTTIVENIFSHISEKFSKSWKSVFKNLSLHFTTTTIQDLAVVPRNAFWKGTFFWTRSHWVGSYHK